MGIEEKLVNFSTMNILIFLNFRILIKYIVPIFHYKLEKFGESYIYKIYFPSYFFVKYEIYNRKNI